MNIFTVECWKDKTKEKEAEWKKIKCNYKPHMKAGAAASREMQINNGLKLRQ